MTHLQKIYALVFVLFAIFLSIPGHSQLDERQMDEFLVALQDSAAIPGLSFAVLSEGRIEYLFSNGLLSKEGEARVNNKTIFEAASLTKPVAALCAMKLVEEGILELDRSLADYLSYPSVMHDSRYKLVTARMVLSHTSGLPNWRSPRNAEKAKFKFKPGKQFSYSGEGFVYLQKVMEEITGKNLDQLAQEIVFGPLGMEESSLVFKYETNFALGHGKDSNVQRKFKPDAPNAAYSLHTNANDYALFMNELFMPSIVGKDLLKEMTTQKVLMKPKDNTLAWGLGIGLNFTNEESFAWHWGDNGAFKAFAIISTDTGKGLVFFANSHSGLSIVRRALDKIFASKEVMKTWDFYKQI